MIVLNLQAGLTVSVRADSINVTYGNEDSVCRAMVAPLITGLGFSMVNMQSNSPSTDPSLVLRLDPEEQTTQ